jgi:hypothetical protein
MNLPKTIRTMGARAVIGAALLIPFAAAPTPSYAGVIISVGIAPPVLPVYAQPPIPGDGYIWTPGYWAYGPAGYYWVPGTWVIAPTPGYLWTPAYWGWEGGAYIFHAGYWGPHIGFYGGISYGFGYFGHGFEGGYWNGGHFFYNSAYANFGGGFHPTNVYVRNVTVVNNYNRVSFNGGTGGVPARPMPAEQAAMRENHIQPTAMQQQHFNAAAQDRGQLFSANHGNPQMAAARTPQEFASHVNSIPAAQRVNPTRDGFGHANEVNARQGNQQQRINQGVNSGQLTPGETRNLQNRDTSIKNQAQADRAANGGSLTPQERQQINQRQNNVSNSIAADKHNANNDAAAAARNNRAPQQEHQQAQRVEKHDAPHPKEDHPHK